jgi:hypothetical protein
LIEKHHKQNGGENETNGDEKIFPVGVDDVASHWYYVRVSSLIIQGVLEHLA